MADEYEEYNYDADKLSGHGGKSRSKKAQAEHKDHGESSGRHDRIAVQKLENNREHQKEANLNPGPKTAQAGAKKDKEAKSGSEGGAVDIDSI